MDLNERTLSDVHLELEHDTSSSLETSIKDYKAVKSRFVYTLPNAYADEELDDSESVTCNPEFDEDGDYVIKRSKRPSKDVLEIEHTMSTRLQDVGLQVWQGCLLLCDFIIQNHAEFLGSTVVELGGGTGLASIVISRFADTTVCTDTGAEISSVCQRNIESNNMSTSHRVIVRELDWKNSWSSPSRKEVAANNGWDDTDIAILERTSVIIAADVIYDEDLTDAFFRTVYNLTWNAPQTEIFITIEKRVNFTMAGFKATCPACDHFHECLTELKNLSHAGVTVYHVQELPTDFHQYFNYNRTKYLELWKIWTTTS